MVILHLNTSRNRHSSIIREERISNFVNGMRSHQERVFSIRVRSDDVDEDISFSTAYKALFGSKRRKHLLEVLPRFESWQVACQDSQQKVDKYVVV